MKKKIKVAVLGANGRMGQEIRALLSESKKFEPFVGLVRKGKAEGFQHSATSLTDSALKKAEVWIDFSSLELFDEVVKQAALQKKPLVSGTTGLSEANKKNLAAAAKKTPILWSSNLSVGIAALKKALRIAQDLEGFDFQIEEVHHRRKKDAPSGTAKDLQTHLQKHVDVKLPEVLSIRGGGIFGVHKVWMMSDDEVILLEHQALNRTVFAKGALVAADWILHQSAKLHSMEDLFGADR